MVEDCITCDVTLIPRPLRFFTTKEPIVRKPETNFDEEPSNNIRFKGDYLLTKQLELKK